MEITYNEGLDTEETVPGAGCTLAELQQVAATRYVGECEWRTVRVRQAGVRDAVGRREGDRWVWS